MPNSDLIDALLKHADIVEVISQYIPVIKRGRNYLAVCPFHDDKNPSLNISKEKQIFKCFSCSTGGNAITFVQKYEKISFRDAVKKVAQLTNFHDPRLEAETKTKKVDPRLAPLYACINDLDTFYRYGLTIEEAQEAKQYLADRHIEQDQIDKYGVGYAPKDGQATIAYLQAKKHSLKSIEDIGIAFARLEGTSDLNAGRLIFPLCDPYGQVVGFSARRLSKGKGDSPKYINSPETPIFHKGRILYNYHRVYPTAHRDGYCYVLEGFMDVMALDKAGIHNAIAIMGTALTPEQVELLKRLRCEIRLCLDGDEAGQKGMMKIIGQLSKARLPFRLVSNPGDLRDPDDILQESGPEALKEAMGHLVDPFAFQLDYYLNTRKLETVEERGKVLNAFLPYLRSLEPGIEKENAIVRLAKATSYEPDAIRAMLGQPEKSGTSALPTHHHGHLHPKQGKEEEVDNRYAKLKKAERTLLFYMLQNVDAIAFYKSSLGTFYDQTYAEIANYLLDYAEEKTELKIGDFIGFIQSSNEESSPEDLINEIIALSEEKAQVPYDPSLLGKCVEMIDEERVNIAKEVEFDRRYKEAAGNEEEQLRITAERARYQASRRRKPQPPKED